MVVGKKERKHQRKQSVRQIPPTNAQKVRHSHAPLITIIWSCSPHVHPVQRGGREVFSRLLMNNNQASLFWTRSRSPDFILQRPVRYLHALTYLSMLSPLPASPLVCLWKNQISRLSRCRSLIQPILTTLSFSHSLIP